MGVVAKRVLLAVLISAISACADGRSQRSNTSGPGGATALSDAAFAALIERLSEPGGYFDTDNLISNETSYLHVIGTLRELGVSGGAYIGVGPDQNFSYIAAIRPSIAFNRRYPPGQTFCNTCCSSLCSSWLTIASSISACCSRGRPRATRTIGGAEASSGWPPI